MSTGRVAMLVVGALAFIVAAPLAARTPAEARHISRDEARALVLAGLRDEGVDVDSPKFELFDRPDGEYFPNWYQFDAHMDTEFIFHRIGGYAVLPTTGETWQEEPCMRLTGEKVGAIRAALQRRYGLKRTKLSKRSFCPQEYQ